MSERTVTRSIEADLDPDAIVQVLADPTRLPQWAPGFADAVEPEADSRFRVTKNGNQFTIEVIIGPAARTVDFVREIAPGKRGGAFARVLPRPGGGSVLLMTLPVTPGTEPDSVSAILNQELRALIDLSRSQLVNR